jgi:polyisoprenoid-binding protein YceI
MSTVTKLLSNPQAVGVWTLVRDRSTLAFTNKTMWGLMNVKGRFTEFSGEGQITDTGAVFGRLDIKAASLTTGLRKRDKHLRSADFFDVERYPEINVVVTRASPAEDDTVYVRTDVTIKGKTVPLPLRATVALLDDGAVRVTTRTVIPREEVGLDFNQLGGMLGNQTTVSADLVFQKAAG